MENEKPNDIERQLIESFVTLEQLKDKLSLQLKETQEKIDSTEAELMQLLDDQNKKSSSTYIGLGHVTCVDPTPYARIEKGQESLLFASLREMGREDMVKETVNTNSLSVLVRECIKNAKAIPSGCSYYLKRRLQFTPYKP